MIKQLAFRNEIEINSSLSDITGSATYYYQKFIDRYKAISILPELQTEDLINLMRNPRSLILTKLTKGETLSVGGIQLSSEKVFELLDKPVEVDQLINDIESLREDSSYMNHHYRNIENFEIEKGKLQIKKSLVEEITERNSKYISSDDQFKALEIAKELLPKLNKLLSLCDVSKLSSFDLYGEPYYAPLERLFKGTGSTTSRTYEIDLKSICDAF